MYIAIRSSNSSSCIRQVEMAAGRDGPVNIVLANGHGDDRRGYLVVCSVAQQDPR